MAERNHLMRRIADSEDAGAIAILYALSLLVMIGFAALALDLGALRNDRRAAQTTADFASVAAASNLGEGLNGSPRDACVDALDYFRMNTPSVGLTDTQITAFCAAFPADDDACWGGTQADITRSLPVDPYLVTVAWPVDVDADGYSDEIDGDRCERFSVRINRTRDFVFGRALDVSEQGGTGAFAVGRARASGDDRGVVNLHLLDRTGCDVLRTSGSGEVRLEALRAPDPITGEVHDFDGRVYIESDGSACSGNQWTVYAGGNSRITAEGNPDTPSAEPWGRVRLFAQPPGGGDCAGHACLQTQVRAGYAGAGIWPQPVNLPERIGRTPVDHRYNCKPGYPGLVAPDGQPWEVDPCDEGAAHIDALRTKYGTAAVKPSGYQAWNADLGHGCTVSSELQLPAGDYYIDCGELRVRDHVTIAGGNLVFRGGLRMGDPNASFTFNENGGPAYMYFGGTGTALNHSNGTVRLHSTTLILRDSHVQSTANADLLWEAPTGGDLAHLALWSDGNMDSHRLTGSGGIALRGAFFAPNSTLDLRGGGAQIPNRAQFVAWNVELVGNSMLRLTPDPSLMRLPTFEGVHLIR